MFGTCDRALLWVGNTLAANRVFDALFPILTNLHQYDWILFGALLLAILLGWRGGPRARVAVLCAVLAVGVSDATAARLVKRLVPRERPCHRELAAARPEVGWVRLVPGTHCPGSRSFPSNHAANMAALASVGCWFTRGRKRWWWLALPVVIGYTRIYLGFHYPSDVLGGWALGAVIGLAVAATGGRMRRWPRASARVRSPDG
ncbi:MAG: phosphatase PAP2 family protein [Chthonomonadales bacterium]|nr:phosphatase PAP2 family protein [Chthonomonadales bacterium]